MKPQSFVAVVALVVAAFCPRAHAQDPGIALAIQKHAQLTADAAMIIRIQITCGPFEGTQDFQEGFAGGGQEKTGAESESGIDGAVVCDGVQRTHTARLPSFTEPGFKHGPASANASVIVCMLVADQQQCFSGSHARRVIIRGATIS